MRTNMKLTMAGMLLGLVFLAVCDDDTNDEAPQAGRLDGGVTDAGVGGVGGTGGVGGVGGTGGGPIIGEGGVGGIVYFPD
jgi:hypothetical protein